MSRSSTQPASSCQQAHVQFLTERRRLYFGLLVISLPQETLQSLEENTRPRIPRAARMLRRSWRLALPTEWPWHGHLERLRDVILPSDGELWQRIHFLIEPAWMLPRGLSLPAISTIRRVPAERSRTPG